MSATVHTAKPKSHQGPPLLVGHFWLHQSLLVLVYLGSTLSTRRLKNASSRHFLMQVVGRDETSPVTASRVLDDATASAVASGVSLRNQRQRILSSEQPFWKRKEDETLVSSYLIELLNHHKLSAQPEVTEPTLATLIIILLL